MCVCVFQWDIRSGEVVQEYDRHLGAVNTITFVDENRRFVSTSDDKSLRVWEWYGLLFCRACACVCVCVVQLTLVLSSVCVYVCVFALVCILS